MQRKLISQDSYEFTISPTNTKHKFATITMMLAKRIARNGNEWSVDNERYFDSNAMNVWQTLEYLSSVKWRKRFNYEGYNDAKNALRMLTPSWRRDSFAEKSIASKVDEPSSTASRKTQILKICPKD
uniref:Uncharacterized protein n=1 Tax=Glossina brevipalpis TaxID=37001 RepID=A0A1A9W1T4_9MUSC